jgi:hypothetical protein
VRVRMKSKTRQPGSLARLHDTRLVGRRGWSVVCGAPAGGEFGWRWACLGLGLLLCSAGLLDLDWATTLSTAGRADLHLPLPVEPA